MHMLYHYVISIINLWTKNPPQIHQYAIDWNVYMYNASIVIKFVMTCSCIASSSIAFSFLNLLKIIGLEKRLFIQKPRDHTSMWTMLGERAPTLLQPCSLFPSLYHHIDKPYGITISLPPYFNMLVVLTYLKSTYVFDYLQHLSTT